MGNQDLFFNGMYTSHKIEETKQNKRGQAFSFSHLLFVAPSNGAFHTWLTRFSLKEKGTAISALVQGGSLVSRPAKLAPTSFISSLSFFPCFYTSTRHLCAHNSTHYFHTQSLITKYLFNS